MGKVTSQTVTIKKSPVSTFGLSRTKSGSARIGDLNVVEHIMMEPADMVRCSVDTQILFISPLSVPAFARMKVFTYFFFDAYQNVYTDFNETIQNYTHDQKSELRNGVVKTHSNYTLPNIMIAALQSYINCGLHWLPPQNATSTTIPVPPFGNPNSYDDGFAVSMFNYKMQYDFCFSSYEQKVNICKLCNQFDIPFGLLQPLSKDFQGFLTDYFDNLEETSTDNRRSNSGPASGFDWSAISQVIQFLPFTNYWSLPYPNSQLSGLKNTNQYISGNSAINILPFKCYQHIFNDWFLNTQKNTPIDLFPDNVSRLFTSLFERHGEVTIANSSTQRYTHYPSFQVFQYNCSDNYYMNSLFQIRQPWYSKDYFNVSTNDPTLGVSPYAVGTSILDLRKNSALQRLAEKKALCGNKFVDFIVQHFNYYPPDLEIGRSIHLGTNVDYVNINTVLQTSETTSESPQGERAATASAYGRSKGVFFKAPTYGEFMVLQCVKPEIDYYDGIPREMLITDVSDVPLPELSQIGFDKITMPEISVPMTGVNVSPSANYPQYFNSVFGYAPRYSWRKTRQNRIYGELANTLAYWHQSPSLRFGVTNDWHFGQIGFDSYNSHLNTIGRESAIVNPSYNRIFAITDVNDDTYVYQHSIKLSLRTALPTNDSPQL